MRKVVRLKKRRKFFDIINIILSFVLLFLMFFIRIFNIHILLISALPGIFCYILSACISREENSDYRTSKTIRKLWLIAHSFNGSLDLIFFIIFRKGIQPQTRLIFRAEIILCALLFISCLICLKVNNVYIKEKKKRGLLK